MRDEVEITICDDFFPEHIEHSVKDDDWEILGKRIRRRNHVYKASAFVAGCFIISLFYWTYDIIRQLES